MSYHISLFDSFVVTIFSMVVVFLSLIVIAYLINGLSIVTGNGKKKKDTDNVVSEKTKSVETIQENSNTTVEANDEELVAVIAAAVAASLGLSIPEVNIRSIRRVPQNTTPWSAMNKNEQIFGRL